MVRAINCTSQTDQIDRHMGLLEMNAISDLIPFRFFIDNHGVGISTERIDGIPECIQVNLCPFNLPIGVS